MEKHVKIRILTIIIISVVALTLLGILIYVRILTNTTYTMSIEDITYEYAQENIPELIITDEDEDTMQEINKIFEDISSGEIQSSQLDISTAQEIFDIHIPHIEVISFNLSPQAMTISGQHSGYDYTYTVSAEGVINKSVSELIYEESQSSVVYMNTDNSFFTQSVPKFNLIESIF